MANKQALKNLQSRLAEKPQATKTLTKPALWLAVHAGSNKYLFPLSQSGEVFSWAETQSVPYTQPWFMGVTNLRGALYGVVDFASFISNSAPHFNHQAIARHNKLIGFNDVLDINCVLLVDRVIGLQQADAMTLISPNQTKSAPEFFGPCYSDSHGDHWQEINLQLLAQQARFLAIGS